MVFGKRARRRERADAAVVPGTLFGRFLLAVVLRRRDEVPPLVAELDETDWERGDELMAAMFGQALPLRFQPEHDVRDITRFVRELRLVLGPENDIPPLEAEAVIRHGLGEDVFVADIELSDLADYQMKVFDGIVHECGLSPPEITELIMAGERAVAESP